MNTAVLNSIQSLQDTADTLVLPAHFPQQEYTPFGYIDNPSHSTVLNRSIRNTDTESKNVSLHGTACRFSCRAVYWAQRNQL
jgi:hypothetical protein